MDERHTPHHQAVEKGRGTLWLLWLIPLFATLMAGWLIYEHYAKKGTDITVVFNSGKGLVVDKTPLIYQGIKIGTVTDINIDPKDLYKVETQITVIPRAAKYIARKGTRFIKVEPKISLTEISGLDTILSGVYIEVYPAGRSKEEILKQPPQYSFVGLDHYPPKRFEKGLYLTLRSDEGSLNVNAPVLYKKFVVGKVIDKTLHGKAVDYTLLIRDRYRHLVSAESRFWKVSGVELKASLAGVKLAFDSLATLMAGGIAFETPDTNASGAPKPLYRLYDSRLDTHLDDRFITLVADKAYNIDPEFSSVMYKGFKVGKIVDLTYDTNRSRTLFTIRLDKKFDHLANDKAWFWIVRPVVNIREIKGLDAVITGPYIAFDTTDTHARPKRRFRLHDRPLPRQGRRIHLKAAQAESLKSGTAIFFKDIPIGQINKIDLVPGRKLLDIEAVIFDRYTRFLNDSSMFYVKSGFEMEASFRGIHIDTGSLETMVVGGIAMVTLRPDAKRGKTEFPLYKDYRTFQKARYLASGGAFYHIRMKELGSLHVGSPILYKKLKAGEVIAYRYLPESDAIDVTVFIEKAFKKRINASTRFRNVSGLELKVALPDLKLKMDSLETVINGGLAFETPDPRAKRVKKGHRFTLFDEAAETKTLYDTFTLRMEEGYGIRAGTPLLYKELPVGRVKSLRLRNDMVVATVLIQKRYRDLLRRDTIIWLKRFEADIKGVKNPGNLLAPALVLTPGHDRARTDTFTLRTSPPPPTYGRSGLRIVLEARRRGSLDVGAPVMYRQVPIGSVESWVLSPDATHVEITAFIRPRYAHLVRRNARFYMAGAIGLDVSLMGVKVRTETLETMISGGIGMAVPDQPGPVVETGHRFPLYDEAKEAWLHWQPAL